MSRLCLQGAPAELIFSLADLALPKDYARATTSQGNSGKTNLSGAQSGLNSQRNLGTSATIIRCHCSPCKCDPECVFGKRSNSGCFILPAILGGRLFLFLPHFILSDIFDSGTKEFKFRSMADQEALAPTKQKQWQMRMVWTQYRRGKWIAKQLSDDMLLINGIVDGYQPLSHGDAASGKPNVVNNLVARLPGIQTFKFWVSSRQVQ